MVRAKEEDPLKIVKLADLKPGCNVWLGISELQTASIIDELSRPDVTQRMFDIAILYWEQCPDEIDCKRILTLVLIGLKQCLDSEGDDQ